jgi:hypothetical protein
MKYDIFISHASEDKDFVKKLVSSLKLEGVTVWFDEQQLKIGDSLREAIDRGLAHSQYGVVILSNHFFSKRWPQRELDGLIARDDSERNVILPVWHSVTIDEVRNFSPMLSGIMAVRTEDGLGKVVRSIVEVVRPELGRRKARVLDDLIDMVNEIWYYLVRELDSPVSSKNSQEVVIKATRDALRLLIRVLQDSSLAMDPSEVNAVIESAYKRFSSTFPMDAYCVHCKKKLNVADGVVEIEMKSRMKVRRALRGYCPSCGTAVFRILGKKT